MLRILFTEHVTNAEVFTLSESTGHFVGIGGITGDLMIERIHGTRPSGKPENTDC